MKKNKKYFGPVHNNRILVLFFRKITGKDTPSWFRKNSILTLFFKPFRKLLNVVIIPSIPFNKMRIILYRFVGYKIGSNVFIGMKCYLDDSLPDLMEIEDNVTIAHMCIILAHGRTTNGWENKPILIKEGVYIGAGVKILPGVTIGENATVGAGSVVTKDIKENSIVVGVPAKEIKKQQL